MYENKVGGKQLRFPPTRFDIISNCLLTLKYLLGNLVLRIDGLQLGSILLGSLLVVFLYEVVGDEVAVALNHTSLVGTLKVGLGTDELDELLVVGLGEAFLLLGV